MIKSEARLQVSEEEKGGEQVNRVVNMGDG